MLLVPDGEAAAQYDYEYGDSPTHGSLREQRRANRDLGSLAHPSDAQLVQAPSGLSKHRFELY